MHLAHQLIAVFIVVLHFPSSPLFNWIIWTFWDPRNLSNLKVNSNMAYHSFFYRDSQIVLEKYNNQCCKGFANNYKRGYQSFPPHCLVFHLWVQILSQGSQLPVQCAFAKHIIFSAVFHVYTVYAHTCNHIRAPTSQLVQQSIPIPSGSMSGFFILHRGARDSPLLCLNILQHFINFHFTFCTFDWVLGRRQKGLTCESVNVNCLGELYICLGPIQQNNSLLNMF